MFDFTGETLGIGVDIENISRFQELDVGKDGSFFKKTFTGKELDYCFSSRVPAQHLAARFAGKEAILKALSSLGRASLGYNDIEIENDNEGVPCVAVKKEGFGDLQIRLSLSHARDVAVAFAIVMPPGKTRYGQEDEQFC